MNTKTPPAGRPWRITDRSIAPVTLEKRAEGDDHPLPRIHGYGAVFYDEADPETEYRLWDDFVERVLVGAFDRAIKEDDVRGLVNHDPSLLLGRNTSGTMDLTTDKRGMIYDIDTPDTGAGRDAVASIDRGDMSGSSFSFIPEDTVIRETEDSDGRELIIREINSVRLFDTGPVTYPAYTGTTAEAQRSAGDVTESLEALEKYRNKRIDELDRAAKNARTKRFRLRLIQIREYEAGELRKLEDWRREIEKTS